MKKLSPKKIVRELRNLNFENTFNPYAESCGKYDDPSSPRVRASLLENLIDAATSVDLDAVWIGRDLGHRGGRRTGLALTDDVHFSAHIQRWGLNVERPTRGPVVAERTAAVIWDMLSQISSNIFLWNVFPLHPFSKDSTFSNRAHNAIERMHGEIILSMLVETIRPRRVVAVGNDASNVALRMFPKLEVQKVRHPSYGGQKDFCSQVARLYGISADSQLKLTI